MEPQLDSTLQRISTCEPAQFVLKHRQKQKRLKQRLMTEVRSERRITIYPFFAIFALAITVAASVATGFGLQRLYRQIFPDVSVLATHYPVAERKIGRKIIYRFEKNQPKHWKSLRQISRAAIAAVLASEDGRFYSHPGYEPEAIRKAWEANQKAGKFVKGGSTITQQLVKNLFLTPEKTISRKVRELLLAVEIEAKFSKRKILETYLNIAEWGPGIYGIEQAAQYYFKKPAWQLSAREGAVLAFMLPNPNHYRRGVVAGNLTRYGYRRVTAIMQTLWRTGQISDEEYASYWGQSTLPSSL